MPIKEESFRIGCGRYIQGPDYIERVGEEVLRLADSIKSSEAYLADTDRNNAKNIRGLPLATLFRY